MGRWRNGWVALTAWRGRRFFCCHFVVPGEDYGGEGRFAHGYLTSLRWPVDDGGLAGARLGAGKSLTFLMEVRHTSYSAAPEKMEKRGTSKYGRSVKGLTTFSGRPP